MNSKTIRIATRSSPLALWQAHFIQQQLQSYWPGVQVELLPLITSGDRFLKDKLAREGGKGLFVKELEEALWDGRADLAVHSLKDMPANLAKGLALGAILERADPRDVFVSDKYESLSELPTGSIVGTSSLRRQAQVLAMRSDLEVISLRGNVETRLEKLVKGQYSGIILAAAGLERLGLRQWLGAPLAINIMLPAAGLGALGVEYKIARIDLKALLAPLNHAATAMCVTAERAMNAVLDGGCQAPIASYATLQNEVLILRGLVANPNGKTIITAIETGTPENAKKIGESVASKLLAQGAGDIIQNLKGLWQNNAW